MKTPKPKIPEGAPPGTVWFGGPIEWTSVTLRIRGDGIDPDALSRTFGCQPEMAHRKGDPILKRDGTIARLARTGAWHLSLQADETDEWDPGEAMLLLLQRLSSDVELWKRLTEQFAVDFYVSLRMRSWNKGFSLSPAVMSYLGECGIEAGFDILHSEEPGAEQVATHEPPPVVLSSDTPDRRTLDSPLAPDSSGGR